MKKRLERGLEVLLRDAIVLDECARRINSNNTIFTS